VPPSGAAGRPAATGRRPAGTLGGRGDAFRVGGPAAANSVAFGAGVTVDGGAGAAARTVGDFADFAPGHPLQSLNILEAGRLPA
jgi:hypothetical protein